MPIVYDAKKLDEYIDEDLNLIHDKKLWTEFRRPDKNKADICYIYQASGDSIWWIKLVANIPDAPIEDIDDLLDASLKERHAEWHELYIDGRILQKNADGRSEICYFQ